MFPKIDINWKENKIAILLIAITFFIHLGILLTSSYAFGVDGYYYAAQVNSYVSKGRFFSPDSSPVLYLLVAFSYLGNDIVLTNKIVISLLSALLFLTSYLFGLETSRKSIALLFASFVVSTSFVSHFSFNFVKNLGGIICFLLLLKELFLIAKNGENTTAARAIKIGIYFVLCFLTHKLMAGLSFLVLLPFLVRSSYKSWKVGISVITVLFAFIALGVYFLPNLLHWEDAYKLKDAVANLKFTYPFYKYAILYHSFYFEILIFASAPFIFLLFRKKIQKQHRVFYSVVFVLYWILCFPFFDYTVFGIAFRFFLIIFIPASILYLPLLSHFKWDKLYVTASFLLLFYQGYSLYIMKDVNSLDYELYESMLPLIKLPPTSLIIVHQGFDYFICFQKKGDAFHFLPEEKHKNRPIYRIAYGVPKPWYEMYLKDSKVQYLPGFYSLLSEGDWQFFLKSLPASEKSRLLNWMNPHTCRDSTMLRNEKFKK